MHRFSTRHRDRSMDAIVSYKNVPVPRGLAFAMYHVEKHNAPIELHSGDRRDAIIAEHNHAFGTHLHGQQWLIDAHARDPQHYSPANPVNLTSHCYFSDGNAAYERPRGARLPWYMCGLDLDDRYKQEDPSHFLFVARWLGYKVVQPYAAGSERHHVVFITSPLETLERWNVIAKERHV